MPEPVISVRGEASLEVEPEIAVVWVTVQARDADRHRAVELLARRSGAVSSTIKGFGEAIEKLESQPVNRPAGVQGRPGQGADLGLSRPGRLRRDRQGLRGARRLRHRAGRCGDGQRDRPGLAAAAGQPGVPRRAAGRAPRTPPSGRGSTRRRSAGGSTAWSRPPTPGCSHRSAGPVAFAAPCGVPRRAATRARVRLRARETDRDRTGRGAVHDDRAALRRLTRGPGSAEGRRGRRGGLACARDTCRRRRARRR